MTTTMPFSCTVCSYTIDLSNTTSIKENNVRIQYSLSTGLYYIVYISRLIALLISKQICWNDDMQHEIKFICNIRIKLRIILYKFRYFLSIYYIIDFLKVRNAQIYQVELYFNQTYTLPKDTWQKVRWWSLNLTAEPYIPTNILLCISRSVI